jgi:hypothetical protein
MTANAKSTLELRLDAKRRRRLVCWAAGVAVLSCGIPALGAEPTSIWAVAPGSDDVDAVYPPAARDARLAGGATIACVIGDDRLLSDCTVEREDPGGFGTAALALATKFRANPTASNGAATAGVRVRIPLRFLPPEPALREVRFPKPPSRGSEKFGPVGPYYPVQAGRRGGEVIIDCSVAAGGRLRKCRVVEEAPRNIDFGHAAVRMAEVGWIVAAPKANGEPEGEQETGLFLVRFAMQD